MIEARIDCLSCNGTGRRAHSRITYRHRLGRPLHEANSGALQWGDAYRAFHEQAWRETTRVCRPRARFVLHVKDHERRGVMQPVVAFHCATLSAFGWRWLRAVPLSARGMRYGANREQRAATEYVILFGADW